MIDKAKLVSNTVENPKLIHAIAKGLSKEEAGILDRHYLFCRRYLTHEGSSFVIKTGPKQSNISNLCIELNPSHFSGLKELNSILSTITPLESLRFTRLDYSSDLPVRYIDLWKSIDVKYKVLRDRYRSSQPTGLYFGSNNHLVNVYDKTNRSFPEQPITRIEAREKHKSLTVNKISELHKLLEHNPFDCLRIMNPKDPTSYGSPKSYEKLKNEIDRDGLSVARKILGRQNNFEKTYGRYLEPSPYLEQLNENHKNEITKFLRS